MMFGELFMSEFRAADNTLVTVRPLLPDDAPLLVEIFGQLSPESRYRRFNESLVNADDDRVWAEAEQIAHGVARNSRGLLAFVDRPEIVQTPIGGVRYVMSGPEEAELAVSVADEYQRLGIGSRLVELLVEEARRAGLKRLVGVVRNENIGVFGMLRKLPYQVERHAEGPVTTVIVHLDRPE
jgi:acetyltransferase